MKKELDPRLEGVRRGIQAEVDKRLNRVLINEAGMREENGRMIFLSREFSQVTEKGLAHLFKGVFSGIEDLLAKSVFRVSKGKVLLNEDQLKEQFMENFGFPELSIVDMEETQAVKVEFNGPRPVIASVISSCDGESFFPHPLDREKRIKTLIVEGNRPMIHGIDEDDLPIF